MDIPKKDRPSFMDAMIRISPISAGFFHIYCRKFRKVLISDLPILTLTVQNFQLQESLCLCCLKAVMFSLYKHLSLDWETKFFTKACSNKWENHWEKAYFITSSWTRFFMSTLKTIKSSRTQAHKWKNWSQIKRQANKLSIPQNNYFNHLKYCLLRIACLTQTSYKNRFCKTTIS